MVVQLLVFYYVLLPIIGWNITGVQVAMLVFGLNSGAYISEIMRSGIQSVDAGQMEYSSDSRKRIYRAYQRNIGCKFRRRGGSVCGV